jgi:hypothetical protein
MLVRMRCLPYKTVQVFLVGAVLCSISSAWSQARQFQFEKFPAKVYQGPIRLPAGLHLDKEGAWRDALEKWVAPPEVSFAGEYYLAGHSCGAGCRYYQLENLRTGTDLPAISIFNGAEPLPVTKDGHPYLTMLYARPDSRLLIAEYHLDFDDPEKTETCRQRYFVLEDGKLRPISKTFPFCTEGHEP